MSMEKTIAIILFFLGLICVHVPDKRAKGGGTLLLIAIMLYLSDLEFGKIFKALMGIITSICGG
jgi:hypothetical protein